MKIGDAENWCRGCRLGDKNRFKKAKIPVRFVLSRVLLSLESEIRPIKCQICPPFTSKTQIKKSFVCFVLQIAPF